MPEGLLPAYLAVGGDELKRREVMARMGSRHARSGGDPAFNREDFDGAQPPSPELLRSALDTLPFGDGFRLVAVRRADALPKPVSEAVVAYLQDPCPTTVLVMTAEKLPRSSRLYKAVAALGPKAVIDCAPRKRADLEAQVASMARARGLVLGPGAAAELVARVGESAPMLDSELARIAGSRQGAMSAQDVREAVARVAPGKPWGFLDAVCARDPALAMRELDALRGQSEIGLLSLLVTRLRELMAAKSLERRGRPQDLAQELGLQPWQVKRHAAWARGYTEEELARALEGAAACDAALKSRPDPQLALRRWVLSFCRPR